MTQNRPQDGPVGWDLEDYSEETLPTRATLTGRWILSSAAVASDSQPINGSWEQPFELPLEALEDPFPLRFIQQAHFPPQQLLIETCRRAMTGATNNAFAGSPFELVLPPFELQRKTYITTRHRIPFESDTNPASAKEEDTNGNEQRTGRRPDVGKKAELGIQRVKTITKTRLITKVRRIHMVRANNKGRPGQPNGIHV